MNKIIIFVMILCWSLSAISKELTCSINGTEIIYVNGIKNEISHVVLSKNKLKKYLSPLSWNIDRTSVIDFDYSYNESVDFILDFLESGAHSVESMTNGAVSYDTAFVTLYRLWFSLPKTDPINTEAVDSYYLENYEKINELLELEKQDVAKLAIKIKDKILLDDRKVLIVSHSQGNFFANKALLQLSELPDFDYEKYKGIIGNIRVASPVSKVIADYSVLVQNSADVILKVPGAPAANYFLYVPHPDYDIRSSAEDKKNNHSFIETYMFDLAAPGELYYNENQSLVGLRKRTIKAITDTAAKLRPHPSCPYCTDTFFNEDFEVERRVNPDGSLGGYVSTDAYVEPNVYLSPNSIVCGEAVVANSVMLLDEAIVEGSATVFGNAIISGKAIVSDLTFVGDNSVVEGNSVVLNRSYVLGNVKVSEDAMILDETNLFGDSKISGSATIAKSAMIAGNASVVDNAIVSDETIVIEDAIISGSAFVSAAVVSQKSQITGNATLWGLGQVWGGIIRGESVILDHGRVSGNAIVVGNTLINGTSGAFDNAIVKDDARILDAGLVSGEGRVEGNAIVRGNSDVGDKAVLSENAILHDFVLIMASTKVYGNAEIFGNFVLWDSAQVFGHARLDGYGSMWGTTKAYDHALVSNSVLMHDSQIYGNAKLLNGATMMDSSYAKDNAQITGNVRLRGTTGVIADALVCGDQEITDQLISGSGYCY